MRQYFAAGLIAVFGVLLLWIGVSGRMGVVMGALLCPGQMQTDNPDEDASQADLTRALPTNGPVTSIIGSGVGGGGTTGGGGSIIGSGVGGGGGSSGGF